MERNRQMSWKRLPAVVTNLRNVKTFADCTDRQLMAIVSNSCMIDVPAATVLCHRGDTSGEVFVLLTGTAVVEADFLRPAIVGPGAIIGEIAFLDGGPRTATVTTEEPSTVLVFSPREFDRVLREVAPLTNVVLATVAARFRVASRGAAAAP
jgi:CRP-like cAMP-binding protein